MLDVKEAMTIPLSAIVILDVLLFPSFVYYSVILYRKECWDSNLENFIYYKIQFGVEDIAAKLKSPAPDSA